MRRQQLLPIRLRADLFTQLAAMEQAGLPPDKAWGLLNLPAPFQSRVELVKNTFRRGSNAAIAAQSAGLFSPLEANLVRAALLAGSPAQTYRRLAQHCAQSATNEGKMRSGMVLPVAVLVVASVVAPIPQWVAGSLNASDYVWQVLKPFASVVALALAVKWLLARPEADAWRLGIPTLGRAIARGQARNFFESLGLLLEAGVPMFEALPVAVSTVGINSLRAQYASLLPAMQRGATLSAALRTSAFTPLVLGNPQVIEFIATGEASGRLPEMLARHAAAESQALTLFWQSVAQWVPRLVYAAVACWMAYGLLTGAGFGPRVPSDL